MQESTNLVLVGGAVSLISALAGVALQNWFELLRQKRVTRQYPTQVLFNKQAEFYDRVAALLPEVNGYITAIDVWLGETSADASERVRHYAGQNKAVWQFHELVEQYFMYLPRQIMEESSDLFTACMFLSNNPTTEGTAQCLERLFSFQNTIRRCVGVDAISKDLLQAFGAAERTAHGAHKG